MAPSEPGEDMGGQGEERRGEEESKEREGGAREGQRIRIEWKEEGDRQLGRVPEEEICDLCCNPRNGPKRWTTKTFSVLV